MADKALLSWGAEQPGIADRFGQRFQYGRVSDEAPPLDAGAQERPGITDVNDPGVAWQDGFDPSQWKTSWHNPLMTDNPPGYTGGPGPERDAAWRSYLAATSSTTVRVTPTTSEYSYLPG